jgi:hypothetical protein
LLSNLYLNEVDRMLERAREVTRNGKYTERLAKSRCQRDFPPQSVWISRDACIRFVV